MTTVNEKQAPVISVVCGRPTSAEIAAVVAVLLAADSPGQATTPPVAGRSVWAGHSRTRPAILRPGPHSWRASALPR